MPATRSLMRLGVECLDAVQFFWWDWSVPGAVEVAAVDLRTAAERAEFAQLRRIVLDRLAEQGLDDVAAMVDTNLFGASLDARIDHEVSVAMARMLIIGEPAAVFVVPIGVEPT